jgi:cytochrome c oxidase cbb3-type subunit 3
MPQSSPHEDPLRPHSFDGIQEYDKRLPNWWLWTLYGAIIFSAGYWGLYHRWGYGDAPGIGVEKTIAQNTLNASKNSGVLTDEQMWQMVKDDNVIAAGRATYNSTCASCHMSDLSGKIGPTLIKDKWIHGGKPHEIVATIVNGVPAKGMPTWGPVLGRSRIVEVVAFVLSHNKPPPAPQPQ